MQGADVVPFAADELHAVVEGDGADGGGEAKAGTRGVAELEQVGDDFGARAEGIGAGPEASTSSDSTGCHSARWLGSALGSGIGIGSGIADAVANSSG